MPQPGPAALKKGPAWPTQPEVQEENMQPADMLENRTFCFQRKSK